MTRPSLSEAITFNLLSRDAIAELFEGGERSVLMVLSTFCSSLRIQIGSFSRFALIFALAAGWTARATGTKGDGRPATATVRCNQAISRLF